MLEASLLYSEAPSPESHHSRQGPDASARAASHEVACSSKSHDLSAVTCAV